MKKILKTSLGILLAFAVFFSFFSFSASAANDEILATVVFGSDWQYSAAHSPGTAFSTTRKLMGTVKSANPNVDLVLFCGDYTNVSGKYNYDADASTLIKNLKNYVSRYLSTTAETMFLQGNHDIYDSSLMAADGAVEYENYIVYIMNTQSANPWNQGITIGAESKVKASADALEKYLSSLIEKGETRPVIIATHVPLHMSPRTSRLEDSRTGDNKYNGYIFDVVNSAAENLDIFYFYGHNHANGYDSYLGGSCVYRPIGSTLAVPDPTGYENVPYTNAFNLKTLNFTYMNAGFTGYNSESSSCGELTLSVMNIYADRVELHRYNTDGECHLGADGKYNLIGFYGRLNDSKGYKDDNENIYRKYPLSSEITGPATVTRNKTHGLVIENGNVRWYENGQPVAKGLVTDGDGNYYYINGTKKAVKNCDYAFDQKNSNGLLPAGKYSFGADGKLIDATLKNGITLDADGVYRFYRWGEKNAEGVVEDGGKLRYFDWNGVGVKNSTVYICELLTNGYVLPGNYTLDSDGYITDVSSKKSLDAKGDIMFFGNGSIGYRENGQFIKKGIVQDEDGNIYYIGTDKKAVTDEWYTLTDKTAKGLVPAGRYYFGSDGVLVENEGLVIDDLGNVRYYENNVAVAKGLVTDGDGNYYYINGTKKAVKDCQYAFNAENSNGLLPAGKYTFDADGRIILF